MLMFPFVAIGAALWAVGAVGLRLAGTAAARLFEPVPRLLGIYVVSFVAAGFLVPAVCHLLGVPEAACFQAAVLIALPTLLIDAFTCLFFTHVFPRLPATVAPRFGGWMMICCAGGFVGVLVLR
jgi:uncharacterized protein DUF5367